MLIRREETKEVRDGLYHFPIRPVDIDTSKMFGTFGKFEVERTAENLVKFFQRRRGWYPFTAAELEEFYCEIGEEPKKMFFGMMGCWIDDGSFLFTLRESHPCIVVGDDGMYAVTDHFIKRCAGHYRDQKASSVGASKIYYRVVIAGGKEGGNIRYAYDMESDSDEAIRDAAKAFAELLTRSHGIAPDSYWVAYIGRIFEKPLFQDPRLGPKEQTLIGAGELTREYVMEQHQQHGERGLCHFDDCETEPCPTYRRQTQMQSGVCEFERAWQGPCGQPTEGGQKVCSGHLEKKCRMCDQQATRECEATAGGFVCGTPLCSRCRHGHE